MDCIDAKVCVPQSGPTHCCEDNTLNPAAASLRWLLGRDERWGVGDGEEMQIGALLFRAFGVGDPLVPPRSPVSCCSRSAGLVEAPPVQRSTLAQLTERSAGPGPLIGRGVSARWLRDGPRICREPSLPRQGWLLPNRLQTLPKATWQAAFSSSASSAVLGLRPFRVPRWQSALRATSRSPDSIEKLTD